MVSVTRHNFDTVFPQFESDLKKCSYVSLDCEFSYLPIDDFENSFFDNGEDRYLKIRNHLQSTVVLQVGLSLFTFMRDLKKYNASLYRFYIVPRPFGPVEMPLLFKSSNVQFLCRNKFDFNKCFYDGISFLNETQESLIRKMITDGSLISWIDRAMDYKDLQNVTTHGSAIAAWLANSSFGETYEMPVETNDISYRYFVHQEIRRRFEETWTFNNEDNTKIIVKHVNKDDRRIYELNKEDPGNIEHLIESLRGFSKLFKLLATSKKPLVGHNLLFDLLIMYNQFYQQLPSNYTTFKSTVHEMFPQIYDTKLMAFEIQKLLNKVLLYDTSLGNLYQFFQDEGGTIYEPYINMAPGVNDKDQPQRLHDAGWDSYFTGFCFIKLGYYYLIHLQNSCASMRIITFKECLNSLSFLANKISLARAKIPYVNLSGKDPVSTRPPVLHVRWKSGKPIDRIEIASLFNKYGLIHKKEYFDNSILLATSNYGCYKDILRDFKQHKDLKVERYSLLRHHTGCKMAMCLGVLLPIGWTLWYSSKIWKL
uniref:Putative polya-specific ribonuclease parn-like domain-containing protein 1 n=1 Tax=Triatoma infestans TaxID=30076 RepID=A0A023EY28_TRIIF